MLYKRVGEGSSRHSAIFSAGMVYGIPLHIALSSILRGVIQLEMPDTGY